MQANGPGSVVVGGDVFGIVSTGPNATNVQSQAKHATVLPPEALVVPAAVDAPPRLVHLPLRPGTFVGRGKELDRLDAALAAGPGGVVVQAVHGLGGIGKSTLAARWATGRVGVDNPVWWITADTPAAIDAGLADLAVALQPALSGVLPLEALRERALLWLASHADWLLILDNVTDPADISPLLARVPTGLVVVTSRRATGWTDLATPLRLDVLEPAEAVELMTGILTAHHPRRDLDGVADVCEELGYLPLAVEQAAAYLSETGISPRAYLELLAEYPADLYRQGGEGRDAEHTIARIWRVTLDRLADDPLCGHTLRVLAWYAPEAIPRRLLEGLGDEPAVLRAIGRLAAYNMITADTNTLTVHRLVQAVARTPDPDDPHRSTDDIGTARAAAVHLLAAALPGDWRDPADWPTWRALLPHIGALADHTAPDTDTHGIAYVLNQAGQFLQGQGGLMHAIGFLERAHTSTRHILGDDHAHALAATNNLANAYQAAGDPDQAIPLYEQTLTNARRLLGNHHPHTLILANNLATAYQDAGDPGRAILLLEQTLADRQRVLGDHHPQTLITANNLGQAYQASGDLDRAVPLLEQTIADTRRVLGDHHPDTLIAANNLGQVYQAKGDPDRAIPLLEQTLADTRRDLGDHHPDTLITANNLAGAYQDVGDFDRAILLYERTLTDIRRFLGDTYPRALAVAGNLAGAYRDVGDLDRAIPLFEQTLTDTRRILGNDHPDTLILGNNLATAYHLAGEPDRAIPLLEQTVTDARRVLGNDHPETLKSANNLAQAYQARGEPDRAIPLLEQTLADRRRVLVNNHPGP